MTTVQETKSVTDTVELENSALVELLEGASTHASKDKSLYALNSVQLEGAGAGYLVARATDRFRLIEGKIEIEYGTLSKSLISLSDVKRVIELAKSNKVSKVTLNRTNNTIDQALEKYTPPPMPDMVSPVYTEKPSDTSTRLPEMRLTAPWYTDTAGTD